MAKQVIVWRNDLKIRKGKIAAQCCHASLGAFIKGRKIYYRTDSFIISEKSPFIELDLTQAMHDWITGIFTKIVVYVNNEQELLDLHKRVEEAGIGCVLIKDRGLTEFHGVETITCLGIGPDEAEKIDVFTRGLPLL